MAQALTRGRFTTEEIDQALVLLARRGGNCQRTAEELTSAGLEVSHQTLRRWKTREHVDRYYELAATLSTREKDVAILQGFRDAIAETQDLSASIREKLGQKLDDLEAKDMPKALQHLAIAGGIATEKTLLLEGRPTEIHGVRNPDWYDEQLREYLEDQGIVDAEVVEESAEGAPAGG